MLMPARPFAVALVGLLWTESLGETCSCDAPLLVTTTDVDAAGVLVASCGTASFVVKGVEGEGGLPSCL